MCTRAGPVCTNIHIYMRVYMCVCVCSFVVTSRRNRIYSTGGRASKLQARRSFLDNLVYFPACAGHGEYRQAETPKARFGSCRKRLRKLVRHQRVAVDATRPPHLSFW